MKNELFEKDTQQSVPGPLSSKCLQSQVRSYPYLQRTWYRPVWSPQLGLFLNPHRIEN